MTPGKRLMDLALALVLGIILLLPMGLIAVLVLVRDGRPVLYGSERMKTPTKSFRLWKFRTMTPERHDSGVSSGYKEARITPLGRILRRTRLDELPQLFNILRGDMSFVGPRPPLRRYVEMCPDIYAEVLKNRPGVTGLATLVFHRTEERRLAKCRTPEETEDTYVRRCIPVKARLDLIWARNRSLCHDAVLIARTAGRVFSSGRGR